MTFVIVPAVHTISHNVEADKLRFDAPDVATLVDKGNNTVAIIPLKNVAAVYRIEREGLTTV